MIRLVADFEEKIAADRLEADLKYAEGRAHKAQRWEEEKARRLEEEMAREAEYVATRAREREEEKTKKCQKRQKIHSR